MKFFTSVFLLSFVLGSSVAVADSCHDIDAYQRCGNPAFVDIKSAPGKKQVHGKTATVVYDHWDQQTNTILDRDNHTPLSRIVNINVTVTGLVKPKPDSKTGATLNFQNAPGDLPLFYTDTPYLHGSPGFRIQVSIDRKSGGQPFTAWSGTFLVHENQAGSTVSQSFSMDSIGIPISELGDVHLAVEPESLWHSHTN